MFDHSHNHHKLVKEKRGVTNRQTVWQFDWFRKLWGKLPHRTAFVVRECLKENEPSDADRPVRPGGRWRFEDGWEKLVTLTSSHARVASYTMGA